jgi:2-polyprenyl-3-methyl-5-hydroxy-6-metoxy-1,4-benzoquinol methylase
MTASPPDTRATSGFDHDSNPEFFSYYEKESLSEATRVRFARTKEKLLAHAARHGMATTGLEVADIGCGAGTQCRLWAADGHKVNGLDVNGPLIELAKQRAAREGLDIQFHVGTATALPFANDSMDVCLLPELLEHVADWQSCLNEAVRVVRPGGMLYLSTTNWLCPVQQEFTLPMYSWYPGFIKRRIERLSVTTRPALANHAKYPAVNWFSFYSLSRYLGARGMQCFDRFDMIDASQLPMPVRLAFSTARALPPTRFLGHVFTEGTMLSAFKRAAR